MKMNHPEVLIIPVLMLLDYFLTIWGAVLSEKKYAQHFNYEHYELNPYHQKSIAEKKWFNPKYLAVMTAVAAMCFVWGVAWNGEDGLAEGMFGFATILSGSLVGRHLSNICIFRYFIRHPNCVSGETKIVQLTALNMARSQIFILFFPLLLIAIFSPTPFVIGAVVSQVFLFFLNLKWISKAKSQLRKPNPT